MTFSEVESPVVRPGAAGTRVILADSDGLTRELIRLVLARRGVDVACEATRLDDLVSLCKEQEPDVIVTSVWLEDGSIEDALDDLVATGCKVIVLSDDPSPQRLKGVLSAGAAGYLLHDCSPERVVEAVLSVAAGGVALHPSAMASILDDWRELRLGRDGRRPNGPMLTTREAEILGAMAEGLPTKAIARQLGVAVKTVENHKTRIFHKLGARSQAHAVSLAIGQEILRNHREMGR
jgi:DNA-binding NarL/FixJ family response regulator